MSQRVTKRLQKRWALGRLAGIAALTVALSGQHHHEGLHPETIQRAALWRSPSPQVALVTQPSSPEPDTTYLKPGHQYADIRAAVGGPVVGTYTVEQGDTLWSIANTYNTDTNTLVALNPDIDSDLLQPGMNLKVVSEFEGVAYRVQEGDTLQFISAAYLSPLEQIIQANHITDESAIRPGDLLFLPGGRPRNQVASRGSRDRTPAPAAEASPEAAKAPATAASADAPQHTGFIWPISGGEISSEYGYRADIGDFHTGIDIAAPYGTQAGAAASGTVTSAGWDGNYGYCVVIDHGGGIKTKYGHGSAILVSVGQHVAQGQVVLRVGHTGRATGDHLHLEFIVGGKTVNPRNYLPAR